MNFLNLKAVLSLNGSGFALGLKRAESASKQFAREIKGQFAQAFGMAAIVAYGAKIINMADNIIDLSERLGISTKALQEWNYAAQKSGSSIERVTKFLEHLAVVREKALGGDQDAISGLAAFGITDPSMDVDAMGRQVGRKIASGDFSRKALQDIGGKGVGELIPALRSMDELANAASRAGRVLSDETLEALKQLKNEAMDLADTFSGPVARSITKIGDSLKGGISVFRAGVGAPAAFLGALSGGASVGDAWKAANDAFDKVVSEWEANKSKIAQQVANRQAGLGSSSPADILHAVSIPKQAAEKALGAMPATPLTGWQQAGAAVRFNPDRQIFERIARSTEQTARNTAETPAKVSGSIGNLGGGFS